MIEGILVRRFVHPTQQLHYNQLVTPTCLQVRELHDGTTGGGHLRVTKTLEKLRQWFYWPGHFRDIQNWCQACGACATRKTPRPHNHAPLQPIPVGSPAQLVAVDTLGPFQESSSGNRYILVVVDHFTKWSEAYAIPNQEATTVARKLTQEWFFRFSPPESLLSDQGEQFESQLIQEICRLLQIKKLCTSAYHPQCDGTVERYNRTLLSMLRTNQLSGRIISVPCVWHTILAFIVQRDLHPFISLLVGKQLPIDLTFGISDNVKRSHATIIQSSLAYAYVMVRNTLGDVQPRQKALYDRRIHGQPFNSGDKVWLYSNVMPKDGHRKLHHPWTGPYLILERLSDVNYKVQSVSNPSRILIVHFDRQKLCVPGTRFQSDTPPSHPRKNTRPPKNVCDYAELVDDDVDPPFPNILAPPQAPPPSPRLPRRAHRPPDWLILH